MDGSRNRGGSQAGRKGDLFPQQKETGEIQVPAVMRSIAAFKYPNGKSNPVYVACSCWAVVIYNSHSIVPTAISSPPTLITISVSSSCSLSINAINCLIFNFVISPYLRLFVLVSLTVFIIYWH